MFAIRCGRYGKSVLCRTAGTLWYAPVVGGIPTVACVSYGCVCVCVFMKRKHTRSFFRGPCSVGKCCIGIQLVKRNIEQHKKFSWNFPARCVLFFRSRCSVCHCCCFGIQQSSGTFFRFYCRLLNARGSSQRHRLVCASSQR